MVAEGLFERDGAGPERRLPRHRRRVTAPRPGTSSAPDSPTPRTSPVGAGTGTGTSSPSASPSRSGRPATPSATASLALGGAAVHNGLYVSPHPWEDEVRRQADAPRRRRRRHARRHRRARRSAASATPAPSPRRLWPLDDARRALPPLRRRPRVRPRLPRRAAEPTGSTCADEVFLVGSARASTVEFQVDLQRRPAPPARAPPPAVARPCRPRPPPAQPAAGDAAPHECQPPCALPRLRRPDRVDPLTFPVRGRP